MRTTSPDAPSLGVQLEGDESVPILPNRMTATRMLAVGESHGHGLRLLLFAAAPTISSGSAMRCWSLTASR